MVSSDIRDSLLESYSNELDDIRKMSKTPNFDKQSILQQLATLRSNVDGGLRFNCIGDREREEKCDALLVKIDDLHRELTSI